MNSCVECVDLVCEKPADLEVGGGIFATTPFTFVIECSPRTFCFGIGHVVIQPPVVPPVIPPPNTGNPIILRLQGCISEIVRILPANSTKAQIEAAAASMQLEWASQAALCGEGGGGPPPTLPPPRPIEQDKLDISGISITGCLGDFLTVTLNAIHSAPPPLAWLITSGTLPPGMSGVASGSSFVISGTPTAAGNFVYLIRVTDSLGNVAQRAFTISVIGLTSVAPPSGSVGVAYSFQFTAAGGSGSYTFTSTGTLPNGLTLSSSGLLSGTPTTDQTATFSVCVTQV
jgi:putative Ig domain-containing protein